MEVKIYQYESIGKNQYEKDMDHTVLGLMMGENPTQDMVNRYYTKMCNITIKNEDYKVKDDYAICEDMYKRFNSDYRPNGKTFRSMCVGDIISIDDRQYICDTIGFIECNFTLSTVDDNAKLERYIMYEANS